MSSKIVTANGFPKMGNHALVRALELLGIPTQVRHFSTEEGLPCGTTHHVLVKRNPRNVVISKLRVNRKVVTPGMFAARFRCFEAAPLVDEMRTYQGWLTDPGTLVVRYEDLIASDREMRRIAQYLGVPYLGDFALLPGETYTWNPIHSDWRTIWTPELDAIWRDEGGSELEQAWGYDGGGI